MAKNNDSLEARIQEVIGRAVNDAIDTFRQEVLTEVSRSFGAAKAVGPAAAPRTAAVVKTARASGKGSRSWPTCSVPGCGNNFFGPSGSARFCYQHYLQSGGQHPAKVGTAPADKAAPAPRAATRGKGPRGKAAAQHDGHDGAQHDGHTVGQSLGQILDFIARNPGLRSEQIQKHVGIKQPVVKAALAKLRAAGQVKTQGARRSTTYSSA